MNKQKKSTNKREHKGNSLLSFPSSYTIIDVETTGFDPNRDSLIEVSAIRVRDDAIVESYSSLINPGHVINDYIQELTGITNQELSTAPDPSAVLDILFDFIGDDILVGHNIHFDINFLYDNFERYLNRYLTNNFIDTLRLCKKRYKGLSTYKLSYMANYLNIPVTVSHRALADCETTQQLYSNLKKDYYSLSNAEKEILASLSVDQSNPFYKKRIYIKGTPQFYSLQFIQKVFEKCNARLYSTFYKSSNYALFSEFVYKRYISGTVCYDFDRAKQLCKSGTLSVLSEMDWCNMLGIPIPSAMLSKQKSTQPYHISAKDITTANTEFDETHPLYSKLCVFTGTLEKMPRRDAMQAVVNFGGQVGNSVTKKTNYLILGNNDYNPLIKDGKSSKQKRAEELKLAGNDIEILSEDVFYDLLQLDE